MHERDLLLQLSVDREGVSHRVMFAIGHEYDVSLLPIRGVDFITVGDKR